MIVTRTRPILLACTALVSFSMTQGALAQSVAPQDPAAQTDGPGTELRKIVVKSDRIKGVADTPLASEVTARQIENGQITSIDDLGRSVEPGVAFVRDNGSINIRGLEGARVLTLIDGIPIPYLQDGGRDAANGGLDSFDFNSLSGLDVIRGADSSRAGSGALGGALALRTLEPQDLIGEGKTWGGLAKLTYDSMDNSFGGALGAAKRIENTSILFEGGYKKGHERDSKGETGGYGPTRSEPNPDDYDQNNVLVKLRQDLDGGHRIGITGERFERNLDRDLRTLQSVGGNYRPGNWDGIEDTPRDRVSLDYTFESTSADSLIDNAQAVLYWQDVMRASGSSGYRYQSVIGDYSRLSEVEQKGWGLAGQADKTFETGSLSHTVTFGGNFASETTSQYSSGVDTCSDPVNAFSCLFLHTNQADMPDVDSRRVGLFLDDRIAVGNSGFSLTPGVRFDWYDHAPQDTAGYSRNPNFDGLPAGQSESRFSPKILANYQAAPGVEVFAQWAMAFRAPTADELYLDYGGPGTYARLGNADLKPETSNGFELGTKLGDQDFGGRLTVFHNRYRNFIDVRTLSAAEEASAGIAPGTYPFGVIQSVNRARVRIQGIEFAAHKAFDNGFSLRGSVTYAMGKDLDTGDLINSVAPLKGTLGVGYDTETWGTSLTWIGAKAVSDKSTSAFKAPGYGIVDVAAWWEPEQVKGLKVQAGIYNLFDKEYYNALEVKDLAALVQPQSYYSEPGRTFRISLTQRF